MVEIAGSQFRLRPFRRGDEESLARAGNNPAVARNLVSTFPSPYTLEAAKAWIDSCATSTDGLRLTFDVNGASSGGIGLHPKPLWSPYVFELGYWLAEPLWGRGIVTEAVGLVVRHAFERLGARRVQSWVYDWNPASARVLEKNGFELEGRLRGAVHKDGRTGDCLAYGRLR